MDSNVVVTGNSVWILSGQLADEQPVRDVPVTQFPFQVGRRPDLSLCLKNPTVSGLHAQIVEQANGLVVEDLGSTNGTFVNGRPVQQPLAIGEGDLLQFANVVMRLQRQDTLVGTETVHGDQCNRVLALLQFDRLMNERAVVPFFQPIIHSSDGSIHAYEILGRSHLYGLKMPSAMFQAASQLNLEADLSRVCRHVGIEAAQKLPGAFHIFVNTHPSELNDLQQLATSLEVVRNEYPDQQLTLEIHESAISSPASMGEIRSVLRDLNIGMAYDDFGAGQARLVELCEVPPDYLKFDMQLIRDIDQAGGQRQHMLSSLVRMVQDLDVSAIAEGMETQAEAEVCRQIGFDLCQGFYFGKPVPVSALQEVPDSGTVH